jgi:hypothetical protein
MEVKARPGKLRSGTAAALKRTTFSCIWADGDAFGTSRERFAGDRPSQGHRFDFAGDCRGTDPISLSLYTHGTYSRKGAVRIGPRKGDRCTRITLKTRRLLDMGMPLVNAASSLCGKAVSDTRGGGGFRGELQCGFWFEE